MPTGMTLEQRFELAALAGFEGVMLSVADEPAVEVAIPFKPSAAELKQLQSLAEQYVPITDIWCEDQWAFPFSSNEQSIRERSIERTQDTINTCAELGVNSALLVCGMVNRDHSYRTVWNRSQQSLREGLLPLAEKHNVQLNVETV